MKELNEKNIARVMKNSYDKEFCIDEMENLSKERKRKFNLSIII